MEERAEKMGETSEQPEGEKKVYVEEREVRGGQLLDTVEKLLHESTVRRIRIKNKAGRVVLDIPVWVAAVGGATAVIAVPIIAAVGVIGGLLAGVKVEIEREVEEKPVEEKKVEVKRAE